jgi:acetoin utilization deacetylase AcuC-like enzyme
MKVVFHKDFYRDYTEDPAAEPGRMEAIVAALQGRVAFVTAEPATCEQLRGAHSVDHIESVKREGVYDIAALAAGGAIQAARIGLSEPAFALIRPPGHHASASSCWGFCYFNNMAVALMALKHEGLIQTAFVLDCDLHNGDGTINILGHTGWVRILNPAARTRDGYIKEIQEQLSGLQVDMIGISAGFDHHEDDWGGLLATQDYETMGRMVRDAARACGGGCFAVLEGGYNHSVLGTNVLALLRGLEPGLH